MNRWMNRQIVIQREREDDEEGGFEDVETKSIKT